MIVSRRDALNLARCHRNGDDLTADSAEPTLIPHRRLVYRRCLALWKSQVGLKLVKQNAGVDAFVIDHIEKLSAN